MSWSEEYRQALEAAPALRLPLLKRREAAVLVPLVESGGEPALLLTRRNPTLSAHPGEVSFAGGGVEPGDAGSYDTARREAAEEIGLDTTDARYLGRLDDQITTTGFCVAVHVVVLPREPVLHARRDEVPQILTIPLSVFREPSRAYQAHDAGQRLRYEIRLYNYRGNIIWGATARMIHNLVLATGAQQRGPGDEFEAVLRRILRRLLDAERVLLSTHKNPDADGLGCQVALEELLLALGKQVTIVNHHPTPARFSFLSFRSPVHCGEQITEALAKNADLLLVADTADSHRLGRAACLLEPMQGRVAVLDHHLAGDLQGPLSLRSVEHSCAAELVYELVTRLAFPLPPRARDALYAGLMFDTGGFRYIGQRSAPLQMAAHLVEQGVDVDQLQERLHSGASLGQVEALSRALERMTVELDGRWAWTHLEAGELSGWFEDGDEETGSIAPFLLNIDGVQVSTYLRDDGQGQVRVSLRSLRDHPIGKICVALGGGGHACAGGATVQGSLPQVLKLLRAQLRQQLDNGTT